MATAGSVTEHSEKKGRGLSVHDSDILRMVQASRQLLHNKTYISAESRVLSEQMSLPVTALWCRILRFDPQTPQWPDRDRFIVPSVPLLPLLDVILRLTGTRNDADNNQQISETAPGPAGLGIAAAVGMALAEQKLADRFGRSLVNHRTWVVVQDTDLATGTVIEAAQLAGHFGLDRLTMLVASPSGASQAELSDTLSHFSASGWNIRKINADHLPAITSAFTAVLRARKPTLLVCQTSLASRSAAPCLPLNKDELNGPWNLAARKGAPARHSWLRRLIKHRQRAMFQREQSGQLPFLLHEDWLRSWRLSMRKTHIRSTKNASSIAFHTLKNILPEVICLSASPAWRPLPTSTNTHSLTPQNDILSCGSKTESIAGILNGLALHQGVLACCQASLTDTDRMLTALRMAAFMRKKAVFLLTENKPDHTLSGVSWQPADHISGLRAIPGLAVFRPANPLETFLCWEATLKWEKGPCVLSLSPDENPDTPFPKAFYGNPSRGGYLLQHHHDRQVTLIVSGPEVAIALEASHHLIRQEIRVAVVSLPCWELFAEQPETYRKKVLGDSGLRVGIEAASGFGWERWLGPDGVFINMNDLNIPSQADSSCNHFGVTTKAICEAVKHHLFAFHARRDPVSQAILPSAGINAESHSGKVIKQEWKTKQWQSK